MSQVNPTLVPLIESAIRKSVQAFGVRKDESSLSDLFLYYNQETSELSIYDDMETLLFSLPLENISEELDDAEGQVIASAKSALHTLRNEGLFQQNFIIKPFSVGFVDENFIVSEELFFLDDDTIKVDQDLMKNLDKELNDFLKDLLTTW